MFVEDLSVFFDTQNGFAVTAFWTPPAAAATPLNGIFLRPHLETLEVNGYAPVFRFVSADAPEIDAGDELEIEGVTYTVVNVEPDGTGLSLARLEAST